MRSPVPLGYTPAIHTLQETEDVTTDVLDAAFEISDDWFPDPDERIDWFAFWDRLETIHGFSILNYDSPAARSIQRAVRFWRHQ